MAVTRMPVTRMVVNVASTEHTRRGQRRLIDALGEHSPGANVMTWGSIPEVWPSHESRPYSFKGHALKFAEGSADLLIWADACILPVRSLEPLWQRIEQEGAVIINNGWSSYEWTADSAYPDLFPVECAATWRPNIEKPDVVLPGIELAREVNRTIPHVVAGFFGLNVRSGKGRAILDEYYRLASETRAFCGPHWNSNHPDNADKPPSMTGPCGPPDVRGSRHDQSALSVIAWRNGVKLTDPPEFLIYGTADKADDPRTCVVADGSYA